MSTLLVAMQELYDDLAEFVRLRRPVGERTKLSGDPAHRFIDLAWFEPSGVDPMDPDLAWFVRLRRTVGERLHLRLRL